MFCVYPLILLLYISNKSKIVHGIWNLTCMLVHSLSVLSFNPDICSNVSDYIETISSSDCAVVRESKAAQDDEAARSLWEMSAKMVGLQQWFLTYLSTKKPKTSQLKYSTEVS